MPHRHRFHKNNRLGNIVTLTAIMLPVMFILSAFTINLAYMQLSRTELMVATDVAARAGGRALSELQDVEQAKAAAQATAALNLVAGSPLRLDINDSSNTFEFGSTAATSGGYGRFLFTRRETSDVASGVVSANAIRVNGRLASNSLSGSVDLPMPNFGLPIDWNVSMQSVAMQVDRDIAIVLDRSGSMLWKTYAWPSGMSPWNTTIYNLAVGEGLLTRSGSYYYYAPGVTSEMYQDWVWEEYYELGPAPPAPWDELKVAVQSFLTVLENTDQSELVSLSSYATNSSLDLNLESDYAEVIAALNALTPEGATAIGRGMATADPTLFAAGYARPLAAKTMIVMTDGIHNTGTDPVTMAQQIVDAHNVTIHTITFGSGADQARMASVANIGGGAHYHANNGVELVTVFEEIANNLPTILTE
jgi:Ca-activated chloride channel homolog